MDITPIEAEECLNKIVYIIDNREQPTARLKERLQWLEPYTRETVSAGDYTAKTLLPDGSWYYLPVAVERKMSFTELAGCYCQERGRFAAEFERAKEHGVKLIILVDYYYRYRFLCLY